MCIWYVCICVAETLYCVCLNSNLAVIMHGMQEMHLCMMYNIMYISVVVLPTMTCQDYHTCKKHRIVFCALALCVNLSVTYCTCLAIKTCNNTCRLFYENKFINRSIYKCIITAVDWNVATYRVVYILCDQRTPLHRLHPAFT